MRIWIQLDDVGESMQYTWRMFMLTICWHMGSLLGEKRLHSAQAAVWLIMRAEVSVHLAKLTFCNCYSTSCCGGENSFQIASYILSVLWLASKSIHQFVFGFWLFCIALKHVYKWMIVHSFYQFKWSVFGYTLQGNIYTFMQKKVIVLWHPSCWLDTHSVILWQQKLVSVSYKASVCMCAAVCLSGLEGKGKSAVFNDELLLTTMHGLHKPTHRHVNTYLSLGQLNALDVWEY